MIEWRKGRFLLLFGFLGGISGALLVSYTNKAILEMCVPIMLILVAIYFALAPKISDKEAKERISITVFSFVVAL